MSGQEIHEPEASESDSVVDNSVTAGDLLVILRHAPHGSSWLREGLDTALVAAAFGQRVTLLFAGEGVLALLTGQTAGPLGQKGTHGVIDMLAMYDIDTLMVDGQALKSRGLRKDDLMLPVTLVEGDGVVSLLQNHRLVLNF